MKKKNHAIQKYSLLFYIMIHGIMCVDHAYCRGSIKAMVKALPRPTLEETLSIYENAKTVQDATNVISNKSEAFKSSDLSGIKVTINCTPHKITKLTDKDGVVVFDKDSKYTTYELTAENDVIINGKTVKAKARAFTRNNSSVVWLPLQIEWITLKGKILNSDSTPAVGINIDITPFFTGSSSGDLYNSFPQQSSISDTDGSYELECIKPLSVDMAMYYLINSNAVMRRQNFFFGQIHAKDPTVTGYRPPQIQIPLISEDILEQSRRQLAIMNRLYGCKKEGAALKERENLSLPESKGNVIFLPDIILENDKTKKPHP